MASKPKPKRPVTWIELAVRNGGIRQGFRALNWAHSWIHVRVAFGREPTVDEVAEWWNQPRRTAFREQAAFRECFPTLESPAAIYAKPEQMRVVKRTVDALAVLDAAKRSRQRPSEADLLASGLEPT